MLGVQLCTIKVEIKCRSREAKILERIKYTAIRQTVKTLNKKNQEPLYFALFPWCTGAPHLERLGTVEK
jgi:hypothetical protein